MAQNRLGIAAAKIDLHIVQYGFLMEGLGCAIMSVSQRLSTFIMGMLVLSLGISTRAALQSVLTDFVSRDRIAMLYTLIALCDGLGSAGGALVYNQAFAMALGWDNELYLGLPFMLAALAFLVACGGALVAGLGSPAFKAMSDDDATDT